MKYFISVIFLIFSFASEFEIANAAESTVPEPFQGFDPLSTKKINYEVLSEWLDYFVIDIGHSDRRSAHSGRMKTDAPTGTRVRLEVTKRSLFEGNRFMFEKFDKNEEAQKAFQGTLESLEGIPGRAPLESYSRDEQLAYWLNLYNFTMLNEIISVYPERNLEGFLFGEDSILSKKLLTVAGIPLSLNDIQFTILKENYDNNPLIMYGLYQGIIGGPNIRKEAYQGATVYQALDSNAIEFINSNRGTNRHGGKYKVQNVSSLYARNKSYFPDFNKDLSAHLKKYIDGNEAGLTRFETTLRPVINDWTVTDLWGTFPQLRFSGAANSAALMGSYIGPGSVTMLSKAAGGMGNLNPAIFQYLLVLNTKRVKTNQKNATVTMEELGTVPVEAEAGQEN